MTIAIIAAVILLAIVGYFIWSNQKEKKAKQKSRQNHPSNASPLEKFLETKPQVQSTTKSGVTQTQVGRRNTIASVVPTKPKTSAEIEEEKTQARRNRIKQERELREEESLARQRRLREQEEYDRRERESYSYTHQNDNFMTGIFVGSMLNESTHDHHDEDTSTRVEEQSSNDTSKPEEYTGTPDYAWGGTSSSSSDYSSSSYDGLPAYGGSDSSSSSSDSSSSYSSSYDSGSSSSYDSGSSFDSGSSSGGSDW